MKAPRRKQLIGLAAGAALLAGLVTLGFTLGPFAPVRVSVAAATPAALPVRVFGIGTVEARYSYAVGPTQTGRVARVLVDHGDGVRAGQVLAEMDPVDLEARLAGTRAALARAGDAARAAEAQVREAEARRALAAANAARYRELAATGFVSKELAHNRRGEAEAAAAALEAARAQADAARRDLERLAHERDAASRQLANLKLRSPVDGVVTARLAEPGSTVLAGQALLKVIDPASAWVRVRVDQRRAGALREGQRARIVLRSAGGVPLDGEVARIELVSDAVTEERLVNVTFEQPPRGLSIGELAEVTIDGGRIENALVVPSAALHRAGEDSGVWRVDGGRARFQPVQTGMQSLDGRTELLAGLERGDELIVYANAQLAEGDRVRVSAP
ncbi:MAG: efflux RND transporter periplasmic adaptor subunit [Burkholderiales bacterium]